MISSRSASAYRRLPAHALPADEHRHVLADVPCVVQDPAAELRVRRLEPSKDLGDGRALDSARPRAACELPKRRPEADRRHGAECNDRPSAASIMNDRPHGERMPIEVPREPVRRPGRPRPLRGVGRAAGRTFVLVHGLGGSLLSWLAVGRVSRRHGRVLALDLPGFGRTPRAGRRSRLSDLRRIVSRFIDEVAGGGPVVLVGNSMGGGVSMLQAALEPANVEALVLSNSVFPFAQGRVPAPVVLPGFGLYQIPRVGEWASRQRVTGLEAERAVELGLRIIAADPSTIPPELVRLHVEQLVRHQADEDAGPAFLEAARSLMALGAPPRPRSMDRRVREVPGARDPRTRGPARAARLRRRPRCGCVPTGTCACSPRSGTSRRWRRRSAGSPPSRTGWRACRADAS